MKKKNKIRVVSLMVAVIVWIRCDVYDYFNGHPLKCVASFFRLPKNYYIIALIRMGTKCFVAEK